MLVASALSLARASVSSAASLACLGLLAFSGLAVPAQGPAEHGRWIAMAWEPLSGPDHRLHWSAYRRQDFPARGWSWSEGELRHAEGGQGGDLVTREVYRDFELEFQFRVARGANSGVIYRIEPRDKPTWWTGPEYQVLDDRAHATAERRHHTASLYGLYPATGKTLKPAGEWNSGRIVLRGSRAEHWLNGVLVVEADLASQAFAQRVAKTKFKDFDGFGKAREGHIAFQDHGNEVAYREVRIRRLAKVSGKSFDPFRLDGAGAAKVVLMGAATQAPWKRTDGVLTTTGKPTGWLQSEQQHRDGILEFEWRYGEGAGQGANSGVLFRCAPNAEPTWPHCIEAQLKRGSAGDILALGKERLPSGVRRQARQVIPGEAVELHSPGTWNRYRILCVGDRMQLSVNGRVVNTCGGLPLRAGPIALQSEGAPVHFRRIAFTPLDSR